MVMAGDLTRKRQRCKSRSPAYALRVTLRTMIACSLRRTATVFCSLLVLACVGCESFEDRSPSNKAGDPPCTDCYVVNAAISGWGDRVFVGGYFGEQQTGLVRELRDGSWGQVADSS